MEEYRAIPGFEGLYEASDLGNIRSLGTVQSGVWGRSLKITTRINKGRVLKAYKNTQRGGYMYVNLHKDGRQHMRRVARLVMSAFKGVCPDGQQVAHENGICDDDRLANLAYKTPMQNTHDKYRHGTILSGERSPNVKLSDSDVRDIKASREKRKVIAERYDVHPNHITNIRCGLKRTNVK